MSFHGVLEGVAGCAVHAHITFGLGDLRSLIGISVGRGSSVATVVVVGVAVRW